MLKWPSIKGCVTERQSLTFLSRGKSLLQLFIRHCFHFSSQYKCIYYSSNSVTMHLKGFHK